MYTYTPTDQPPPASADLPEDDVDDESAGTVDPTFEALLDSVTYLHNRLFGGTYTLALPTAADDATGEWAFDGVTAMSWYTTAATGVAVRFPIQFPHLQATAASNYPRLEWLRVRTIGNGHGGVLAAFPMSVGVKRKNGAGTVSTIGGQNDTGTTGTIDTVHDWSNVDLNHELDPDSTYWLEVTNESGANSQPNTFLMRVAIDLLAPSS